LGAVAKLLQSNFSGPGSKHKCSFARFGWKYSMQTRLFRVARLVRSTQDANIDSLCSCKQRAGVAK